MVAIVLAVPVRIDNSNLIVYADKIDLAYRISSVLYTYNYKEGIKVCADVLNEFIINKTLGYDAVDPLKGHADEFILYRTPTAKSLFLSTVYLGRIIPPNYRINIGFLEHGKFSIKLSTNDLKIVSKYLSLFKQEENALLKGE